MSERSFKSKLGWALMWMVVGAGLTFTILSVEAPTLSPPAIYGISAAVGLAAGIFGPMLLELLTLINIF